MKRAHGSVWTRRLYRLYRLACLLLASIALRVATTAPGEDAEGLPARVRPRNRAVAIRAAQAEAPAGSVPVSVVFTDARSNRVFNRWSLIDHDMETGNSLHSDTVPLETRPVVSPSGTPLLSYRVRT